MAKNNDKPKRKRITTKAVQATESLPPPIPDAKMQPEPDDGPWGRGGLTLQQRRFVRAYVGSAAGDATKAAEMAGYRSENRNSLKVTGCRLLTYANVQRALSRAMAKDLGGKKWTLTGLVEIARTSMADFITVDEQGHERVDFEKAQRGAALGSIKKLRCDPEGKVVSLELYDRMAAIQSLAKIHGSLIDRHEHSGPNGGAIPIDLKKLTDDELRGVLELLDRVSKRSGFSRVSEPSGN